MERAKLDILSLSTIKYTALLLNLNTYIVCPTIPTKMIKDNVFIVPVSNPLGKFGKIKHTLTTLYTVCVFAFYMMFHNLRHILVKIKLWNSDNFGLNLVS